MFYSDVILRISLLPLLQVAFVWILCIWMCVLYAVKSLQEEAGEEQLRSFSDCSNVGLNKIYHKIYFSSEKNIYR